MRSRPERSGTSNAPSGRISTSHGFCEAVDDGLDTEPMLFGCHDAGRQRRRPDARQRCAGGALAQLADVDHHRPDVLLVQRGAEPQHRRAGPAVLDAGGNLGVTAAVGPRVVEQARRRAAAAGGAVTVRAHLSEGVDDAARRLRGLCGETRRGHRRAEEGGGERRTGEPSGHGDIVCWRRASHGPPLAASSVPSAIRGAGRAAAPARGVPDPGTRPSRDGVFGTDCAVDYTDDASGCL